MVKILAIIIKTGDDDVLQRLPSVVQPLMDHAKKPIKKHIPLAKYK